MLAINVLAFSSLVIWCSAFNIDTKTQNVLLWKEENGTYFGLSVALHGRLDSLNNVLVGAPLDHFHNKKEGVIYSCDIAKNKCDKKLLEGEDNIGARDGEMFGASIATSGKGKPIIICAPRHTIKKFNKYYLVGKCVLFSKNLVRNKALIPCEAKSLTTYGYCQAGFSVAEYGDGSTVMGAVGTKKGTGALIRSEPGSDKFRYTQFDQTKESDYFGYSVTNGNLFSNSTDDQVVAGGQPRAGSSDSVSQTRGGFNGKVLVYKIVNSLFSGVKVVNPPKKVLEREAFIYFGASVCAVDINGDGYSDLLVGAPFYSDKGDEGRVYVYLSQESSGDRKLTLASGENDPDPGLRGSNQEGARFGWTIVRAGDLNNDRYQDVIIGAPHDGPDLDGDGVGNGAIYIYHGLPSGNMKDYKQKITAMDMQNRFSVSLKQFGYAVSGNEDIDGNEYPDIAVGSWESDSVVLLRSRPVMDLEVSIKLSKKEIPVEANLTECVDDGIRRQCLNATACFKYNGKSVTGEQELGYTFLLDRIPSTNDKRVYIKDQNNAKKYELQNSIKLKKKDTEFCVTFNNILVEDKPKLERSLSSGNNIVFELQYELKLDAKCETDDLCPILDQSEKPIIQEKATLILNCSDNTCNYDLYIKLSADPKTITIGETQKVRVRVTLGNREERAYSPEITVNHDSSLQYEKFEVDDENIKIERRALNSGNESTTEKFRLQGVLENRQEVVFVLQYSSSNVNGNKRKLNVMVETEGTSGQERNSTDNRNSVIFTVRRNVLLSVATTSIPKALTYPITAPPVVGSSSGDRTNFSNVNASLVGPTVITSFSLKNDGKSNLQSIKLQINFPLRELGDDNEQNYIAYPVGIKYPTGNGYCNTSNINPESLKNVGDEQLPSRRKRDTLALSSRTKYGETIECVVIQLGPAERFRVDLTIIAWTNSLVKYHPKDLILNFYASAIYVDPLNQTAITRINEPLNIRVSAEKPPAEKKSTPIWIIIVSVLGGVLLLAIAIFALFKFGFFKRNRPPKDISSPQTDDSPEVPT